MEKIGSYWVDEYKNMWNIEDYTKEDAEQFSETMVKSYHCLDCWECQNAQFCRDCRYTQKCRNCSDSPYCSNCVECRLCWRCNDTRESLDCKICQNCENCRYCLNCKNCSGCDYCCDYINNPQRYVTKRMGQKNDSTTFYYGETEAGLSLQIVCSEFYGELHRGDLEEFEKVILKTYANNEECRNQYLKEIAKVKVLFEL